MTVPHPTTIAKEKHSKSIFSMKTCEIASCRVLAKVPGTEIYQRQAMKLLLLKILTKLIILDNVLWQLKDPILQWKKKQKIIKDRCENWVT